ncbi:MAG: tetratricopeptide repeat protein [Deltaproteobacteria bacterium]|nr:tetratricopeptide repeat protein [Deltaproteobacteria bacterium]
MMSLIHDALKKAKEEAQKGGHASPPGMPASDEAGFKPPAMRTKLLIGVLILAVGFLIVNKWSGKKEDSADALPPVAPTPSPQNMVEAEAKKLSAQAMESYRQQDFDTAMAKLVVASNTFPSDPEVWNNLGVVMRKRGELAKAEEHFLKALTLKENHAEALNNLGSLKIQTNDLEKAKEYIDAALKQNNRYPEALFHRALIAEKESNMEMAINHYKQFLRAGVSSIPKEIQDQVREHLINIEP